MAIEGPLKELNIHDVFQLLDLSRKTGVLRVRSELRQNAGTVFFERGAVVGAQIRTNPHPLGGVLLAAGKISQEDITRARAVQQQGDPRRLGEILIGIGAVSARELQRQVRAQVEEVIFELMGWSEGYFSFEEGEGPADTEADVRITTEALLMEAARRIDEWSRIEGKIPNLGVVPRLGPQAAEGGTLDLEPLEWEILAVTDGTRDVKSISEALGRSDFDVARSLYGLASAGIVLLEAPAAATPPVTGRELAITIAQADDLLAAGDFPAALAGAQSAAAAHPKEAVSHLMVGRVLLAMGRAQESAESFRRAIQLDPLAPPAYRLLGNSLAAQGRFNEALDAWERWGKLGDKAPEEAALAPALLQGRDAARILDSLIRRPIG